MQLGTQVLAQLLAIAQGDIANSNCTQRSLRDVANNLGQLCAIANQSDKQASGLGNLTRQDQMKVEMKKPFGENVARAKTGMTSQF